MSNEFARAFTGTLSLSFGLLVIGCGEHSTPPPPEDVQTHPSLLTAVQAQAARQDGFIRSFVEPTFFDAMANFPFDPADPNIAVQASAINNNGDAVGFTCNGCAGFTVGSTSSPFFAPASGSQTVLPNPYPAGPGMLVDINDSGDMLALGGPGDDGRDFLHPDIYHADGTFQPLPVPFPDWTTGPVPFWAYAINNSATIVGTAIPAYIGTMSVWHFDHDFNDAMGASTLPAPTNPQFVDDGHTNAALRLDGNTCISMTPAIRPWASPGLTFMAWVRPDLSMCDAGLDATRAIARLTDEWGFGITAGDLSLACNGDGTVSVVGGAYAGHMHAITAPGGQIPLGEWGHIAVTTDSNLVRTYVNGEQVAESATVSGLMFGPHGLAIGCRPGDPTSYFAGDIDEVSMFENGLGPDQIRLYANDKVSYPPAMAYYEAARVQNGFFDVIMPPAESPTGAQISSLNDAGVMVGKIFTASGTTAAAVLDPDTGWQNLNDLLPPDSGWDLQGAVAINNAGQIVGSGEHDGRHAMFRIDRAAGEIVDLGHDTDGPAANPLLFILPSSINAAGHVAGSQYDQWPFWPLRAVVYTDDSGLTDLNDLVDPTLIDAGWEFRQITSINDQDEVVGLAYNNQTKIMRGFRANIGLLGGVSSIATVTPTVVGIAQNSAGVTKAIFTYATTSPTEVDVPYGPLNSLSDAQGFLPHPAELPPVSFTPDLHAPFVATMSGVQLTWAVGQRSATATLQSTRLSTTREPDGTTTATLPDGTKVNIDDAGALTPIAEGFANVGSATYAIFSYANSASRNIRAPYGAWENVLTNASGIIKSPSPNPPVWFFPGTHRGALVYPLNGTLTWILETEAATVSSSSSDQLEVSTRPEGIGVTLGDGTFVVIIPNPTNDLQGSIVATEETNFGGQLPASFAVGPDGAATVSVPIWVPPGTAGMQPAVGFSYDSHHTTRWEGLGQGWRLQGSSQITRCSKNLARDGVIEDASVTSDTFCLDGDMMVYQGGGVAKDGSLDGAIYRTEHDRFAKIVRNDPPPSPGFPDNPESFTVYMKDGRIMTYDATVSGPITSEVFSDSTSPTLPTTQNSGNTTFTYAWSLGSISDRSGNTVVYSYNTTVNNDRDPFLSTGDEPCVEQHLASISYGSKQVTFQYATATGDDTPLRRRMFVGGGFCMETTLKMTGVQVLGPRPESGSKLPQVLKQYDLTVKPEGLSTIVDKDSAGVSSGRAVTFHYENASPIPSVPQLTPVTAMTAPIPPVTAPPDKDKGFPGPFFQTGDVNGDGFDDLVYMTGSTQAGNIVVQVSNGGAAGLPAFKDPITVTSISFPVSIQVIDADMDGKADIFVASMHEVLNVAFVTDATFIHVLGYDAANNQLSTEGRLIYTSGRNVPPIVSDLNGDGLADILRQDEGSVASWGFVPFSTTPFSGVAPTFSNVVSTIKYFAPSPNAVAGRFVSRQATSFLNATDASLTRLGVVTGYGDQLTPAQNSPLVLYADKYMAMDLNGDGLSDLVSIDSRFGQKSSTDATRTTPTSFINTGNGFRARSLFPPFGQAPDAALVSKTTPVVAVDLNKDGFDDLLILANDPRQPIASDGPVPGWIYPSNGTGLSMPVPIPSIVHDGDQPFRVLDFNGDGRPDVLALATETVNGAPQYTLKVYRNDQPRPLLTGMSGGLNDTPNLIEYDAVGRVAQKASPPDGGCTSAYPIHCPPVGPLVVTKAHFNNRDLGDFGTVYTYSYSGARMDLLGRGWLGVSNRRVIQTHETLPTYLISVHDTHYGNDMAAQTLDGSLLHYDYPRALRPIGDITYAVGHGNLENTASAMATGTGYSTIVGPATGVPARIYALVADTFITKKRTVLNFDQVLASMSLAFDPTEWPSPTGADIMSSRRVLTFDALGNVKDESAVTNLANGTQVLQNVSASYQENEDVWLISRPRTRSVSEKTPEGSATRNWAFTPDPTTGLLMHETYQSGIPDQQLDTVYGRNASGLPTSITRTIASGESRTSTVVYDDFDGTFPKQVANALGQTTDLAYHPGFGVLVAVRDSNGRRTTWNYDGFGRLRSEASPDGNGIQLHYENPELAPGNALLSSTEVYQVHTLMDSGADTKVVYDILNRETVRSAKDYTGTVFNAVNTSYDAFNPSQPSTVTAPSPDPFSPDTPTTRFTYDTMGRPTSTTQPDGVGYSYSYDTGTQSSIAGPEGQSSSSIEDGRGIVIAKTDFVMNPGGGTGHNVGQSYRYGPFGTLVGIDVTNGPSTAIGYDASGRRISLDDPDTGHSTYKWNGFGDLVQETDATLEVKTYIRDPLGRVQQLTTADGTTTYEWDSSPNGIGRLGRTTSPDNVDCAYSYDAAGRPSTQTWTLHTGVAGADGTYTIGTSYDPAGRLSVVTYPAVAGQPALQLTRTYSPNGSPSGVLRTASSQPLWTVNTRNARGQITTEAMGNGVATTYDYPVATGLLHEATSSLGSQVLRDLVYDYDGVHRVRQRTTDGQSVEIFHYDTIDRLVDWQSGAADGSPHTAYTYDDLGNLTLAQRIDGGSTTSTSFTPGDGVTKPMHQIASSSLGDYSYDARGNQFAAPGRTVAYTSFGLPKSMTTSSGTTSFGYDASQNRVVKVNGSTVIVSIAGLFERRIESGQTTDVFYAIGEGKPVAQIIWHEAGGSVTEDVQYLHDDHLQSIETITDGNGQVVARERFEPFGGRISTAPAGVRLGYQGAEHDDDIGLINMNGRVYDPAQFRFISADPMVANPSVGQDLNRYSFVRNSPLNYRDPSGFDPVPQQSDDEEPGDHQTTYTNGGPVWAYTDSGYYYYGLGYVSGGGSPPDDGGPGVSPGTADDSGVHTGLGGVSVGPGGTLPYGAPGGPAGPPDGSNFLTVPNVGRVSADRVFAANGDYIGPPGGFWGDTSARDNLGIIGPNGEKAKDSSDFWLWLPWKTLSYITGGVGLWNLGRWALGGAGVRVFWNGGTSYAGAAAARWAAANGAKTIGMTPVGKVLQLAENIFGYKLIAPFWDIASTRFAATALGDVHFFYSASIEIRSASVFLRLELPAILENPGVANMGIHLLP